MLNPAPTENAIGKDKEVGLGVIDTAVSESPYGDQSWQNRRR
jgi:hypothetical protein